MGESNLLEGRISSAPEGSYTVQTAFGSFQFDGQLGAVDTGVVISIRPEHLHLEQADGRFPLAEGEVVETGFYGTHHQCLAAVKGVEIPFRVRLPQKTSPSRGEPINLFADPEDMVVLAE
jgi:ABC-type Fe3+/spermidine/putrescine transport system ATPase subunit